MESITNPEPESEPIKIAHNINLITLGDLIWFFFKAYFALAIAALPYAFVALVIALVVSK